MIGDAFRLFFDNLVGESDKSFEFFRDAAVVDRLEIVGSLGRKASHGSRFVF